MNLIYFGQQWFKDKFFKSVLGIEFRDDSLVATCLKNTVSGIKLASSITLPFNKDLHEDAVSEIKKFISQHRINTKAVFVSIPKKWAIIKFMEVPAPEKDSLKGLMQYEVERHVPFQIENVFYDFHALGKNGNSYRIVLVAVQKEKMENIMEFLRKSSLKPQAINISSFCLLNAIELSGNRADRWQELLGLTRRSEIFGASEDVCISLFLRPGESDMAVIKGGSCMYLKDAAIDLDNSEVFLEELSHELNETLSGLSIKKIDRLILSGPGSTRQGLSQSVAEKFGIKVVAINPISKFSTSAKDAEMQELSPSLGACLSGFGLGNIKINILPHKQGAGERQIGPLITKISLPVILLLGLGILASGMSNEKKSLRLIEEGIKKNEPEMAAVEKLSAGLNELGKKKKFLLSVETDTVSKLDILAELTNVIPADAWITNLDYKESERKDNKYRGELVISGFAASSSKLISVLEDSLFFENVEFMGPITKSSGKEGFKIKAVVVKPAELVSASNKEKSQ
ncbi:MAG: pilus assembly protein PilM [Nitrospirae bacterium]|nr:pilus assembly protein PilM [Nitrospirota bacterium]